MREKPFDRELPVTLTDSELQTYGGMLASKVRELEQLSDRKKQVVLEWSTKIKAVDQEIKRIADVRAKGEELRPVKCIERWEGGVIQTIRLDTSEVVDVRPASMHDAQTSLMDEAAEEAGEASQTSTEVGNGADWPAELDPNAPVKDEEGNQVGELVQSSTGADVYVSTDGGEVQEEIGSEPLRIYEVDNETGQATELTASIAEAQASKAKPSERAKGKVGSKKGKAKK